MRRIPDALASTLKLNMSFGASSKAQGSSEERHRPYKSSTKVPPRKAILNSWARTSTSGSSHTSDGHNTSDSIGRDSRVKVNDEENWSEHTSSSGRRYYFNKKTGVSQWEMPQELKRRKRRSSSRSKDSSPVQQQDQYQPSRTSQSSMTPTSSSSASMTPVLSSSTTPSKISEALGVQDVSPPSTPSNSLGSCINHQMLTPQALYTMTQQQTTGVVGQPGVLVLGGQTLSSGSFVRTPVAVPNVATPVAVTPMPILAAVDNQLTQLYSRPLAQPVMQMLPEVQERQARVSSDESLYLETHHLPWLQCKCHVSRLWLNRTELQTVISRHELSILEDQFRRIQRDRPQDPG